MLSKIRLYLEHNDGLIEIFEDIKFLRFELDSGCIEWMTGEDTEWNVDVGDLKIIRYEKERLCGGSSGAPFTEIVDSKFYSSLVEAVKKRIKELKGKIEEIPR